MPQLHEFIKNCANNFRFTCTDTIDFCFRKLKRGHSGSIVYYVSKKRNGQTLHYPWGMLVKREKITFDGEDFCVYSAVVLHQAFQDVAKAYPHVGQLELYKVPESDTQTTDTQTTEKKGQGPVPPRQNGRLRAVK